MNETIEIPRGKPTNTFDIDGREIYINDKVKSDDGKIDGTVMSISSDNLHVQTNSNNIETIKSNKVKIMETTNETTLPSGFIKYSKELNGEKATIIRNLYDEAEAKKQADALTKAGVKGVTLMYDDEAGKEHELFLVVVPQGVKDSQKELIKKTLGSMGISFNESKNIAKVTKRQLIEMVIKKTDLSILNQKIDSDKRYGVLERERNKRVIADIKNKGGKYFLGESHINHFIKLFGSLYEDKFVNTADELLAALYSTPQKDVTSDLISPEVIDVFNQEYEEFKQMYPDFDFNDQNTWGLYAGTAYDEFVMLKNDIIAMITSHNQSQDTNEEAKEEKIGNIKSYPNKKIGDTIEKKFDSSSPPAVWTNTYKVTKIDGDDIYGIYQNTPNHHEFSGADMESLKEASSYTTINGQPIEIYGMDKDGFFVVHNKVDDMVSYHNRISLFENFIITTDDIKFVTPKHVGKIDESKNTKKLTPLFENDGRMFYKTEKGIIESCDENSDMFKDLFDMFKEAKEAIHTALANGKKKKTNESDDAEANKWLTQATTLLKKKLLLDPNDVDLDIEVAKKAISDKESPNDWIMWIADKRDLTVVEDGAAGAESDTAISGQGGDEFQAKDASATAKFESYRTKNGIKINESEDADYKWLKDYKIVGSFGFDQKFFDKADAFIKNEKNPVALRAEIVDKYDEAMGIEADTLEPEAKIQKYIKDVNESENPRKHKIIEAAKLGATVKASDDLIDVEGKLVATNAKSSLIELDKDPMGGTPQPKDDIAFKTRWSKQFADTDWMPDFKYDPAKFYFEFHSTDISESVIDDLKKIKDIIYNTYDKSSVELANTYIFGQFEKYNDKMRDKIYDYFQKNPEKQQEMDVLFGSYLAEDQVTTATADELSKYLSSDIAAEVRDNPEKMMLRKSLDDKSIYMISKLEPDKFELVQIDPETNK